VIAASVRYCRETSCCRQGEGRSETCCASLDQVASAWTRRVHGPSFSSPNTPHTHVGTRARNRAGQQIGPYRLLDKLGEGGMGEVWLAEQTEPVKRKVALKLIKQGMDTKQVVARFEAERQALAMMDHPVIAKIYDVGATPRGRPYFAMEYVQVYRSPSTATDTRRPTAIGSSCSCRSSRACNTPITRR